MEMRIAIIGAGVSGMSIARIIKENKLGEVVIFERENTPGGLIRCNNIDGALFHKTGGHVFNTKYPCVADWFWSLFDRDKEFVKALRNSALIINGSTIPYPIENYIYKLDGNTQKNIIGELLCISKNNNYQADNFEDFLRKRFGETLYEIYFKPYNYKIWRRSLRSIPLEWLDGKLPMPTVEEIIFNNFNKVEERSFVHSSFYYPLNGGSQFIANRLAEGLEIRYNCNIESIVRKENQWIVNDESFDAVIFAGNIKQLPDLIDELSLSQIEGINRLEAHGTTSVFCRIDKNDYSWLYLPDSSHEAHRIICTGNFSPNNNNNGMTATIEFTDAISKNDIIENLKKLPYSPVYICHNYEEYTYPIQNRETRELISGIKEELSKQKFYLLGRFAEWEYYNMDVAINAALQLKNKLQSDLN